MSLYLFTRYGLTRAAGSGGGGDPEPLIQAHPALSSSLTNTLQIGWRFLVGATALTATSARVKSTDIVDAETVRLWRASTETLLAEVDIVTSPGAWVEGAFAAPVTLNAGEAYVITMRGPYNRTWHFGNAVDFTFDPRITYQASHAGDTSGYPPQDTTTRVWGITDLLVSDA